MRWAVLVALCSLVLLLAVAVAMNGGYHTCTTVSTARYELPMCPADRHYVAIGIAVASGAGAAVSGALLSRSRRNGNRRRRHQRSDGADAPYSPR